jgi:hypothetical protein
MALHPQLRALWRQQPLTRFPTWLDRAAENDRFGRAGRALRTTRGHDFAVLVTDDLHFTAELDILLLRAAPPGHVLQRADIDNQLKTLFDALAYPRSAQDLPQEWTPAEEEQPVFCLLEDDGLVTRVNVETDRLLAPSEQDEASVTVRVRVRAAIPTMVASDLIS